MMSSYELNRAEGRRQAKEVLNCKSAVPMQTMVQAMHFLHCNHCGLDLSQEGHSMEEVEGEEVLMWDCKCGKTGFSTSRGFASTMGLLNR